jgi:hypothetical protein
VFAFDSGLLHEWLLVITIVVVAGAALSAFVDWRLKFEAQESFLVVLTIKKKLPFA